MKKHWLYRRTWQECRKHGINFAYCYENILNSLLRKEEFRKVFEDFIGWAFWNSYESLFEKNPIVKGTDTLEATDQTDDGPTRYIN